MEVSGGHCRGLPPGQADSGSPWQPPVAPGNPEIHPRCLIPLAPPGPGVWLLLQLYKWITNTFSLERKNIHVHRANSNNPTLPLPSQTHSVPGGTTVYSSACIAPVHFLGVCLYIYIIWICLGRFIYTLYIVFCSLPFPAHHMSWRSSHVSSHKPASFILTAASEPPYGCTGARMARPPC